MRSAGKFFFNCNGQAYRNWVNVKPKAPRSTTGDSFDVIWADPSARDTNRYDVRYKVGKSGNYRMWKTGVAGRSDTFDSRHNRTYFFQARSRRNGKATAWSSRKKVVTS